MKGKSKTPGVKASKPKRATKPRSGDWVGERFQIVGRPLGKGGMGTVYRVQDVSGVQYALKRLDPSLREEKRFEKRFHLEYEAAANLKHPNITAYHELFEADGALHIRMELVDGINLRQLLKREKILPVPVAVGIARSLARALEHLHAHRVVHRDLKPENVLLGRDGSIKLSDFGISRVEYAAMTRTGTLLGTPRYMSPEQLAGKKGGEIGPESDLYSLGMVLYEMISGKDPYRLRKKAEILEVINVKHQKEPKPLSKDVDASLAAFVMSLLQKEPDRRPQDAREVGQQLGKWSASRREQRNVLGQWVEQIAGGKAKISLPKKKRESFWDKGESPAQEQPQVVDLPSQGRELLPVFAVTILFLAVLWGVGLWVQGRANDANEPAGGSAAFVAPASAAHKPITPQPRIHKAQPRVVSQKRRAKKKRRARRAKKKRRARRAKKKRRARRARRRRLARRRARTRRRLAALRRRRRRARRSRRSRRRSRKRSRRR